MNLLAHAEETIVLPCHAEEGELILWQSTQEPRKRFNGVVKKGKFSLSRKLVQSESFAPVLNGYIEDTSVGSIIFVQYRLFRSSKIFFAFWTLFTLILATYFAFAVHQYVHTIFALLLALGNYLVTILNFDLQVKRASKLLNHTLAQEIDPAFK